MRKTIALLIACLVFLLPFAVAEEVEASAEVSAQAVSTNSLRLKRFVEGFNDIVFKVRAVMTFSQESKLELLKERNEELKTRQRAWLEAKESVLAQFESGELSAEEKQKLLGEVQAAHRAIIKDHIEATSAVRALQLKAKAKGKAELEEEAEATAEIAESSELALGLNVPVKGHKGVLGLVLKSEEASSDSSVEAEITPSTASAVVRKELGLEATDVRTEIIDGTTFYVVSGTRNIQTAGVSLEKNFEAWVEAGTGLITSVRLDATVNAKSEAKVRAEEESDSEVETEEETEIESDEEAEVESDASVSSSSQYNSDGSSKTKARTSVTVRVD